MPYLCSQIKQTSPLASGFETVKNNVMKYKANFFFYGTGFLIPIESNNKAQLKSYLLQTIRGFLTPNSSSSYWIRDEKGNEEIGYISMSKKGHFTYAILQPFNS